MRFFFRYQVGYMYLRYFMWNFAGKQNDIQGHGELTKGNWISGIKFVDQARLGPQEDMPASIVDNKAHNKYYFLPLLLGLAGAFFHYKKHNQDFWVVALLFLLTGFAILVYLNQYPIQPRERDYAYAASFYAFAIYAFTKGKDWIRIPSIIWASVMMTNVTIILFEEVSGEFASDSLGIVLFANASWIIFPLLVIWRMRNNSHPFTESVES